MIPCKSATINSNNHIALSLASSATSTFTRTNDTWTISHHGPLKTVLGYSVFQMLVSVFPHRPPMLERILGTSAKISALRVLVLNPTRSFSLNELASASGCSASTLHEQIRGLLDVIAERGPGGIRVVKRSPIFPHLKSIFLAEKRLDSAGSIFDLLSKLGAYYVTGSSALYSRGLGRDFAMEVKRYLIICDRQVAKSRGSIRSRFPHLQFRFLEDRIRPEDYEEIEVLTGEGKMRRLPVAVPEKAIVDSLWQISEEGSDADAVVYAMLEKVVDMERVKSYARQRGAVVQGRLRWILNEINLASRRTTFDLGGLRQVERSVPQQSPGVTRSNHPCSWKLGFGRASP